MTRRRLTAAAAVGVALAFGLGSTTASADPAPQEVPQISLTSAYWACLVIEELNVGTCIENPLPDASQLPSIPGLLDLLGGR